MGSSFSQGQWRHPCTWYKAFELSLQTIENLLNQLGWTGVFYHLLFDIAFQVLLFSLRLIGHMLLVWTLMGEVICAPLLAPKLGLDNVVKRGLVCTIKTRCPPSHGTLGMP